MLFLKDYETSSGQLINISKSSFFTPKIVRNIGSILLKDTLVFTRNIFLFTYLGCPIFPGREKVSYFYDLISKITSKISGWQSILSMGGHLILIKHVLQSILMYVLAALDPPKQVLLDLEGLFAKFLQGCFEGPDKKHWMSWDKVSHPIDHNGLGISSVHHLSTTFAGKLW